MSKKQINEGVVSAVQKFSDAFFDGLKKNNSNRILAKARERGIPTAVIDQLEKIQKEKDELDKIFKSNF
jgi:4-hydroxy-3-methylbut-2-enyl diphosphate reductase IspH